jgi:DNA-binding transcriptional MocR family regulator
MEVISLAGDAPGADLLPCDELADCAAGALAETGSSVLSYGNGAGYSPLRDLIGQWFGVEPYRVVLTNGWLQGFSLLAGRLARSSRVVAEYPIFDRAERVLLDAGAMIVRAGIDGDGLRSDELALQLAQYGRPTLVYTIPSFHNPTGETMSLQRRIELLALVGAQNEVLAARSVVLEDDSYALTRFEGEQPPALFDLSQGTTVYSSSFSATVAPGLRVAWFILPHELAGPMIEQANATYISPALPAQAAVCEFLARGGFEPHLQRLRSALRLRRDALLAALERHFGGASWTTPQGGFYVWLRFGAPIDGRAVLARAQGVTARAGTEFGSTADQLRLSYAAAAPDEIGEAVARLAAAMP